MEIQLETGLIRINDDGTEEAVKTASLRPGLEGDEIAALAAISGDVNPFVAERMIEKLMLASRTMVGGIQLDLDTWATLTTRDADLLRVAARRMDNGDA